MTKSAGHQSRRRKSVFFICLLLCTALLSSCGMVEKVQDRFLPAAAESEIHLTYYCPFDESAAKFIRSYNENYMYQKLSLETNIVLEFEHPSPGREQEQLLTKLASRNLPDIIGGVSIMGFSPEAAVENGIIRNLGPIIEQYAPEYAVLRRLDPTIEKQTQTDSGLIWSFDCLQTSVEPPNRGLFFRSDLQSRTADYGETVVYPTPPTTIEQWQELLFGYKEQRRTPLSITLEDMEKTGAFVSAFNIGLSFYQKENGTVAYGPLEPEFFDFLVTLSKWSREGLLSRAGLKRTQSELETLILQDKVGAFVLDRDDAQRFQEQKRRDGDDLFLLTPAQNPSLQLGQTAQYRQTGRYGLEGHTVITTACTNVEAAARLLDYGYTSEGALLYNYGIQEVTYTLDPESATPQLSEFMTNNPDGFTFPDFVDVFRRNIAPYMRLSDIYPYSALENECMQTWQQAGDSMVLPPVTLTIEEQKVYDKRYQALDSFVKGVTEQFLMGTKTIGNPRQEKEEREDFAAFQKQLEKMGARELVDVYSAALARFVQK